MLNKSIEAHFTCFDIFHFLTTIKFKIQYVAHIVFILEGTGLEYCEKRDEKGDLLGGAGSTTIEDGPQVSGSWSFRKGRVRILKNRNIEW